MKEELTQEQKAQKMFDKLEAHIGEEVYLTYYNYGALFTEKGKLEFVNAFNDIGLDCIMVPFMGYGTAVLEITTSDGELLYANTTLDHGYDRRDTTDIEDAQRAFYGERIAEESRKQRVEFDRKLKAFVEYCKAVEMATTREESVSQEEGPRLR